MEDEELNDADAEKLRKKIATIKKKLARKCRKLQVSEALSKSTISSKAVINPTQNFRNHSVPIVNNIPANDRSNDIIKHKDRSEEVSSRNRKGDSALPSAPNADFKVSGLIKTKVIGIQRHSEEPIKSITTPDGSFKAIGNISRKQCSSILPVKTLSYLNKDCVLSVGSGSLECRKFFPPFPSKVNLSLVCDFVLPKSFTAMKLDIVRRGKPFNINSLNNMTIDNSVSSNCTNSQKQEITSLEQDVCENAIASHRKSTNVFDHPDLSRLCVAESLIKPEFHIASQKRSKSEHGEEDSSNTSLPASWDVQACLHGASGSPILALQLTTAKVEENICDVLIACQKTRISLWINQSRWSLLQEFSTDEMSAFFFLRQKAHLLVVAVNPHGAAYCLLLGQNLVVEYHRLSVWWRNCTSFIGCCSLDSEMLVLASSEEHWIVICFPDLTTATLSIGCQLTPVDSVMSLSPVNGLAKSLVGLSSEAIYIWNLCSGDLICTVATHRTLGIDQCLWAVTEEGLLYLAIASLIEKSCTFLLIVVNPIVQVVATVIEEVKKLRKPNSLFRSVANKDFLVAPYGSKDVAVWDMRNMELAAVMKSRQLITTSCCTTTLNQGRVVFGFNNGCVHIYGMGEGAV